MGGSNISNSYSKEQQWLVAHHHASIPGAAAPGQTMGLSLPWPTPNAPAATTATSSSMNYRQQQIPMSSSLATEESTTASSGSSGSHAQPQQGHHYSMADIQYPGIHGAYRTVYCVENIFNSLIAVQQLRVAAVLATSSELVARHD